MTIWTMGDVLEYVEHPNDFFRVSEDYIHLRPFEKINRLGRILNNFSKEDQEMYINNFIDMLEQVET